MYKRRHFNTDRKYISNSIWPNAKNCIDFNDSYQYL